MTLQPPFALFILSGSIDTEYINYSLRRAWRGNFMASWDFWVATDNHGDIPRKRNDKDTVQGTVAPIAGSFSSPWIGRSLRDCARWLSKAPLEAGVNAKYFTAMDDNSKRDDTVLVCRVIHTGKAEVEVEFFPLPTDVVAMNMVTNSDVKFDEKHTSYRRSLKSGKADRK